MSRRIWRNYCLLALGVALALGTAQGQESPYIYGIHDHDTGQQPYLDRIANGGATGWVTATLGIGHDPNNYSGDNFTSISNQGHTVIARLNNGYGDSGTIPVPSEYANFAQRCANYVNASSGCDIWLIGNETNLSCEWPKVNGWRSYVSPQSYADCFRLCYNAIKAVKPNAKVLCQALAPFAGPYGPGADHDGNPLGWTTYMNQMLTAINSSGDIDGISVHINSRGYTYADVHSTAKVNGQYFSFYVYKDWVNLGTPASMRTLPYYATECNGVYYWKGGHPECTDGNNPSCSYQTDWMEWIYAEINAWNQAQDASGEGIYRCVNMYRWCTWCDGWNIDGSPQEGQILADLDDAVDHLYTWGDPGPPPDDCWGLGPGNPTGDNLSLTAATCIESGRYSTDQYGKSALDGQSSSKWCCNANDSGGTSTLTVDLGATCSVTGYIVRHAQWAGEPASYNTEYYRVESSSSMFGSWTTEWDVDNSCQDQYNRFIYDTPKNLRYIRLVITDPGTDSYVRLPEFEVYGTAGESATITIEAEDFQGGVNAANGTDYSDTSGGNYGGQYRSTDVDIESCTDGRYNVGWIANGEWLKYPIQGDGGNFTLSVRYATPVSGRTAHLELNGQSIGTVPMNSTGGWQNWATAEVGTVNLGTGWKTISFHCDSDTFNVARFWLEPSEGGGTPPMNENPPTGTNVATSSTQVDTDSNYSPSYAGDKAIDGYIDSGNKWCSAGTDPPHWIKIDLGSTQTVNGYKIHHSESAGEASYYNTQLFLVQVGDSYTGPWTTHADVDNSDQSDAVTNLSYDTPQQVRYVRLWITDPGIDNYVRLPELEVYAGSGGGPTTVEEDFESMPSWSSSYNAGWGSAATWAIVGGGQSGNALQASRSSSGSSAKVKVYNITASTNYTISVYIKCPSYGGSYWAECAYRLGSHTAQDFDTNGSAWTMIKKFDSGTNGNGNTWVQYPLNFNSGSDTQISVGHKLGSSGGGGPTVLWDTLRVN